jgi:SAM-dependent methyltransferase
MSYHNPPEICPVCKEKADFKFIQDYESKEGKWSLYECSKCTVQFWMPFKNPGKEWYESCAGYVVQNIEKPKLRRGYHKQFLKIYKNFSKGTKVLDLGCGRGEFLAELQKRGYEVWGVDFDRNAIEVAKNHFGLKNVFALSFDEFFQLPNLPKFDIITFFEVIEHLDNPLEFIQSVNKLIKEDGLIVLSTPSRERMLVNAIKADFPYHHLSRWNESAISNLFKKINFKIIRVDYVEQFQFLLDALSEKFRFGLVMKTVKFSKDKNDIVPKATFLTKIVHLGAYLKDYILFGIPAFVLFLIGKLTRRKNGDMLIWLKRERL